MIDINNESGVQADELGLMALARFALSRLQIHPQADLSILLADEAAMAEYRQRFMDLPGPTDAMSFLMDELWEPAEDEEPPFGLLGDIVLCPQVTARQVAENDREPAVEVEYLLTHGLLHLLGHDRAEPEERVAMFGLNDRIIAAWEVTRNNCRSDRPVNNWKHAGQIRCGPSLDWLPKRSLPKVG